MIARRDVLIALGAGALTARLGLAQAQARIYRVGWLYPGTQPSSEPQLEQYRRGMRELGYIEGQNVITEYRYADAQFSRLPGLAAELVKLKPDVIVTISTPASLALRQVTTTIPIVFAASSDPVDTGVVASLAHPGGNITGISLMSAELSAKRLELIHAVVPRVGRMAVLWDSSNPGMALRVRETQAAAEQSKIVFINAGARNLEELTAAFSELEKRKPGALLVTAEPFTRRHLQEILDFAARNRIPAMYENGEFVEAGGLMSYGPSVLDMLRRSAVYVDKILKGTKPADLPVEQPTKFELVINLKTAKALGLAIPPSVLARADKVIE